MATFKELSHVPKVFNRPRLLHRPKVTVASFTISVVFMLCLVYRMDSFIFLNEDTRGYGHRSIGPSKAVVVAKMKHEDISWLLPLCAEYDYVPYIYSMDEVEPEPDYLVPNTTRGHEAAAYLSFITTYYDNLPDYTFFLHADEVQWHNDAAAQTASALQNLRLQAVDARGYANLRCLHEPGCPDSLHQVHPKQTDVDYASVIDSFLPDLYAELLDVPFAEVPLQIGHMCCGQFVVTAGRIRERPRADYERILHWATHTTFTDSYGVGWSIEKLWHILFGMDVVYCPRVEQCRCDNFGWCGPLPSGEMLKPIGS